MYVLALRYVCTQTCVEVSRAQIVGLTLEAMGGGQQVPSPRGPPSPPALFTKLLHKLIPAPRPASHQVNPSPFQWAVGSQRALRRPPRAPGSSFTSPGASSQWNPMWALWGDPASQSSGSRHTLQAHHLRVSHPWCWNKKPRTFHSSNKQMPRTQHSNCSLRNSPKVCALQAIPFMYYLPRKMLLLLHTQYTLTSALHQLCMNAFPYLSLDIKMPILSSNKKAKVRCLTASSYFKYSKSPQGTIKLKNYCALFHKNVRKSRISYKRWHIVKCNSHSTRI